MTKKLQYVVYIFSPFCAGSSPQTAEVVSIHKKFRCVNKRIDSYDGRHCIDYKEYEGEKVGDDMTEYLMGL